MKLIWDWNGTLLNDVELGIWIINHMLGERQLPLLSPRRYKEIMGFPIIDYYRQAGFGPITEAEYQPLANEYMDLYREHWRSCALYPGVREFLDDARWEHTLLTASWTRDVMTQLDHYGLTDRFALITSADDHFARGKVQQGREHLRQLGTSPREALMIGDTIHDAQVAREMGCPCVLLDHGHQSRERLLATGCPVVHDLQELRREIGEGV